ncbi:YncE family protein [Yokenella regensburgei]|uniref:7-bladed beta-propeller protein YncE n=1 Tax=Yokenella regensburgei TaxID=158877 RepID=UPI003F184A00
MTLSRLPALKAASAITLSLTLLVTSFSASAATRPQSDFLTASPGPGIYELAYDASQNTLFAASAPSFDKDKTHGLVYRLDPQTLNTTGTLNTSRRAFATALDEANHRLYLGNTLEGSVTLLDTRSGKELKTLQLSDTSNPEAIIHTREMALDNVHHRLYVSGVAKEGVVWVIDTQTNTLLTTIKAMGKWPTGLAVNSEKGLVYVINGSGELVTIDGKDNSIVSRHVIEGNKKHFFLNIALDSKNDRAFITDPDLPNILVVDTRNGKIIHSINNVNSLAVLYNAKRDEIYITHRNAKLISIIDGTSYRLKTYIATELLPNSLALAANGSELFVSLKQGEKEMSKSADAVLKIDLEKI